MSWRHLLGATRPSLAADPRDFDWDVFDDWYHHADVYVGTAFHLAAARLTIAAAWPAMGARPPS